MERSKINPLQSHPLLVPQVQQISAELSHLLLQLQPVRGVGFTNRVRYSSLPEAVTKKKSVIRQYAANKR